MMLSLYSIQDRQLGVFLAPFVARGDVDAIRQVVNTMRDDRSKGIPLVQYPQDYDLWCLGQFNDETGSIHPGVSMLMRCIDIVNKERDNPPA